jgi:hypothetical protein
MNRFIKYLVFVLLFSCQHLFGQEMKVVVDMGEKSVNIGGIYSIKVTIANTDKRDVKAFPELLGFKKRTQEARSISNSIGGKVVVSQQVVQTYIPERIGNFRFDPFTILVNGQQISVEGGVISIVAETTATLPDKEDKKNSFDDFINDQIEFIDVNEDAFLALRANKSKLYVGEGVLIKVAFYVAETNNAEMEFTKDIDAQIAGIVKKIALSNCIVEDFKITDFVVSKVRINNKIYKEYKIYQGVFFPINTQAMVFPSVKMRLLKFKVAKSATDGDTKKEGYKVFTTKALILNPIELPQHPLRDKVVVGNFRLEENISKKNIPTGQSLQYDLHLVGEGNLSSVNMTEISNDSLFDFYSPDIERTLNRKGGSITGDVSFGYQIIPKQAGSYALGDYFNWTFFNPNSGQYETLKSRIKIKVSGPKIENNENDEWVYEGVDNFDDTRYDTDYWVLLKDIAIAFFSTILLLLLVSFWYDAKKN